MNTTYRAQMATPRRLHARAPFLVRALPLLAFAAMLLLATRPWSLWLVAPLEVLLFDALYLTTVMAGRWGCVPARGRHAPSDKIGQRR